MNASRQADAPDLACSAFANALRRVRLERGVGQSELARRIGVKPPYLSALERMNRPAPELSFIERITHALHMQDAEAHALQMLATKARIEWQRQLKARKAAKKATSTFQRPLEIVITGFRLGEMPEHGIRLLCMVTQS